MVFQGHILDKNFNSGSWWSEVENKGNSFVDFQSFHDLETMSSFRCEDCGRWNKRLRSLVD